MLPNNAYIMTSTQCHSSYWSCLSSFKLLFLTIGLYDFHLRAISLGTNLRSADARAVTCGPAFERYRSLLNSRTFCAIKVVVPCNGRIKQITPPHCNISGLITHSPLDIFQRASVCTVCPDPVSYRKATTDHQYSFLVIAKRKPIAAMTGYHQPTYHLLLFTAF